MIKTLLFSVAVCLVVCSATPIEDKWKPVAPTDAPITNSNDKEVQKKFCYMAPKNFDAIWALFKLQKCLKQKKTKSLRVRRSVEQSQLLKNDMERLMEHIKEMTNDVIEQKTESGNELSTSTMNMDTLLSCPAGKNIKIISATLTNKNFATEFPKCWNKKMEHAEWFSEMNEPCSETTKVTEMTSQWCNNKSECKLDWENMFVGVCDCSIKKYLNVTWMCTDKKQRNKRSLHYRNDLDQMALERQFRNRIARLEGIDKVIDYYFNGQALVNNQVDYYPGEYGYGYDDYYHDYHPEYYDPYY